MQSTPMKWEAATKISTTRCWSLAEVSDYFGPIAELADQCGYIASLFGSTVKNGIGRDLDILMVSRFKEEQNKSKFLAQFGGEVVKRTERVDRGSLGLEIRKDGRLYDFRFGRF
jgi:hypothetical protein